METKRPPIYLFTDGAASGNPGPGGYGVVLKCAGHVREFSAGYRRTTNNRMELLADNARLEAIRWDGAEVEVWSDSTYVVHALTEGWLEKWQRSGFAKKKNVDLWLRFLEVSARHTLHFHWLKGHANHPENERCDALAVAACKNGPWLEDTGYVEESLL